MILLIASAAAWECPQVDAPEIETMEVDCSEGQGEVDLSVSAESPVTTTRIVVLDGSGTEVDRWYPDLDTPGETSLWHAEGSLDCEQTFQFQATAFLEDGTQVERDAWWNLGFDFDNGDFEQGETGWVTAGNAAFTGSHAGIDPHGGSWMMQLGWPDYAGSVYGYAYQELGTLAAGTYTLRYHYAVRTHDDNYRDASSCGDRAPHLAIALATAQDDGQGVDFVDYVDLGPSSVYCDSVSQVADGAWVSEWKEEEMGFIVSHDTEDAVIFFNVYGGYSQWGHLVYFDDLSLTKD
ncbi:MAG TPA: hypothetical protein QGF58_07805 [Myxococcota bacterium]|nr:hypothetical protein [Myxococcota bacterium]